MDVLACCRPVTEFQLQILLCCLYLTCSNIGFNLSLSVRETNPTWDVEIRDDVIEECNKHGGVLHVYVDKASPQGNVYVKCPSIATAVAAVNSLHGRWFAGKFRCGPLLSVEFLGLCTRIRDFHVLLKILHHFSGYEVTRKSLSLEYK
jgi:hypothetical protein